MDLNHQLNPLEAFGTMFLPATCTNMKKTQQTYLKRLSLQKVPVQAKGWVWDEIMETFLNQGLQTAHAAVIKLFLTF